MFRYSLLCIILITSLSYGQVYRNYTTNSDNTHTTPLKRKRQLVQTHYEDGTLKSEAEYKDGRRDGLNREYYSTGALKAEIPFKNGREHGTARFFYENGMLKMTIEFERGKPDEIIQFYESGVIKETAEFEQGELEEIVYFDEEGNVISPTKRDSKKKN